MSGPRWVHCGTPELTRIRDDKKFKKITFCVLLFKLLKIYLVTVISTISELDAGDLQNQRVYWNQWKPCQVQIFYKTICQILLDFTLKFGVYFKLHKVRFIYVEIWGFWEKLTI